MPTSTPEYAVDSPPAVSNAPPARRLSGQNLKIYTISAGNPLTTAMTDALVRRFTQETGIGVEQLRRSILDMDTLAVYQTAFEAQNSDVDVVMTDVTWPRLLAPHLVDLAPVLSPEANQHYPSIIQNNTVGNRLVAMPSFGDVGTLFYRSDLLQRYGFNSPPATWEQLEQQGRYIANHERGNLPNFTGYVFQGSAYEGLTCNALEWLASAGGGTIVENGQVTVSNPAATSILNKIRGWIGTVSPAAVTSYDEETTRNTFQSGGAVFMRNWPYAYAWGNAADSPIKGKFDVAPLPAAAGQQPVGAVGGYQWAISQYSRAIDAAVEWVRYVTSPDVQAYRAVIGAFVPTIPAVAARPEVIRAAPYLSKLKDVTRVARPSNAFGDRYTDASTVFYQGVNQILNGRDASAVLIEVQQRLQALVG